MKTKIAFLILSGLLIASCNNSNCNNGVQDQGELGIDCGGNCPACATTLTAAEQAISGIWILDSTKTEFTGTDTTVTYQTDTLNCRIEFRSTDLNAMAYAGYHDCHFGLTCVLVTNYYWKIDGANLDISTQIYSIPFQSATRLTLQRAYGPTYIGTYYLRR